MNASADQEAVYARILARADRSALAKQCADAFSAEVRDVQCSLKQAQEALQALRELQSAARYLRDRQRIVGVASITSGALVSKCEEVVQFNSRVDETLDRAVGGSRAAGLHAVETTISDSDLQDGNNQNNSISASTTSTPIEVTVTAASRKRKLSDTSDAMASEAMVKGDENVKVQKDTCKADKTNEDTKLVIPVVSPSKPTAAVGVSVDFDPSESPIELLVPDSDDSDSEAKRTAPRSSCLESARRLQRGTPANQLSRFPALIQQLQSYVQVNRRDLASSDKAQEFAEAVAIAIHVGMKLQFIPSVRLALASLLVTVEKLEQVVDPLPSPLNEDAERLSAYFLRMTKPQTDQGGDKE